MVLEALQSFLTSILVAYLGVTGSLATYIEDKLAVGEQPIHETAVSLDTPEESFPSAELSTLSRLYATTSGVSRVLFEDVAFQNAFEGTQHEATVAASLGAATIDESVSDALVNIFCEYKTDTYARTTTGTGFFIHENGVILTNAHVAQFLLLESVDTTVRDAHCVIRTGDPATPKYHADLLFISPTWILNNARLITSPHPRGTGEYDYALLYISESLTDEPIPKSFPALPVYTELLSRTLRGTTVVTAGYPAEELSRNGKESPLEPRVAETTLGELYTFGSNYADIFSIAESPVGEQGASGGPVISDSLGTIGLIVTKGDQEVEGERSLRALTLSYINRTITEETGFSLIQNSGGDLKFRSGVFKEVLAPFLGRLLVYEIEE